MCSAKPRDRRYKGPKGATASPSPISCAHRSCDMQGDTCLRACGLAGLRACGLAGLRACGGQSECGRSPPTPHQPPNQEAPRLRPGPEPRVEAGGWKAVDTGLVGCTTVQYNYYGSVQVQYLKYAFFKYSNPAVLTPAAVPPAPIHASPQGASAARQRDSTIPGITVYLL
jgi:hypothetical protein